MARAEIHQTFDTDGNCITLTMTVEADVLDPAETIDECVKRAAVLWHIVDDGD